MYRLCGATIWWMDGTFTANPEIFAQLYTIHIKLNGEFMPVLWCFLPDKQAATYIRLFRLLKQQAVCSGFKMSPTTIHIDFEQAVVQAVRAEYGIKPTGCLFHFCQSILRHIQQCDLQTQYNDHNSPDVRTWIRRLIALPLVPPLRIDQAFGAIVANSPNVPGQNVMNNYVNNTYVNHNEALFDSQVWNCFGQADRTTNACEENHSIVNAQFCNRKPDPYAFIAFLQQQEAEIERHIGQLQQGARRASERRNTFLWTKR